MKSVILNESLRNMFLELINNGYKKHPMCEVTLGASANPQFENFLKGEPLGLKPITRMIDGLKYELHLVPVAVTDNDTQKIINEKTEEFIVNSKKYLTEFLDNRPASTRAQSNVKTAFADQVNDMFLELEKE